MSYILEALKKSQQERELGTVPRLQALTFDDQPAHAPPHRWVYAALLLAVVAVAIALFAVLRAAPMVSEPPAIVLAPEGSAGPAVPPASTAPVGNTVLEAARPAVDDAMRAESPRALIPASARTASSPEPRPLEPREPSVQDTVAVHETARTSTRAPVLAAPESVSVQPEVLVVPAPPKPGQPLARGADELRRAVLGPDSSPSIATTDALPSPPPPGAMESTRQSVPEQVPVPADLIADIEAFKKQVGSAPPATRAARAPTLPPPSRALPAADADIRLPPPPSLALRGKLPEFRMSVHIYDADPARRFVYINGRKLRENDKSREGLRLERVVADGAVLSYQGERFFQPR